MTINKIDPYGLASTDILKFGTSTAYVVAIMLVLGVVIVISLPTRELIETIVQVLSTLIMAFCDLLSKAISAVLSKIKGKKRSGKRVIHHIVAKGD